MRPYDIGPIIERLISAEKRAFDLIFSPDHAPKTIIDGRLSPIPLKEIKTQTAYQVEMLALTLLKDKPRARDTFLQHGSVNTSIELEGAGRFLLHIFRQRNQPVVIMRVIPSSIPTFDSLGLNSGVGALVGRLGALSIVTGQAGSGKSTTLAAAINKLNAGGDHHIITIEDPIEYVYPLHRAVLHQRELGSDTATLADAMADALRQHPQIMMVCELRDAATASLAIEAAESGCLVLTSLTAPDPIQAIADFLDFFPENQKALIRERLAHVLHCITAQRLLPRKDGKGRAPLTSVMIANSRIQEAIRRNADKTAFEAAVRDGAMDGMHTFEADLGRLIKAGLINQETAGRAGGQPQQVKPPPRPQPPKPPPQASSALDINLDEAETVHIPILDLDEK